MRGYIYGLQDPNTKEVVYIGSTVCLKTRYAGHKRSVLSGATHNGLYEYFVSRGTMPNILILEEVDFVRKSRLYTKEAYWIVTLQEKGCKLFNKNIPGKTKSGEDKIFVLVKKDTYISVLKYIEEQSLDMTVHEFYDAAGVEKLKRLKDKNSLFNKFNTQTLISNKWRKTGSSTYKRGEDIIEYTGTFWLYNGERLTEDNYIDKIFDRTLAKANPNIPIKR